jgi:hypothetical protein
MSKLKTVVTTALMVALIALAIPASAHPGNGKGHPPRRTGGIGNSACNDGMIIVSPNTLWPPNHKMVTVDVAYIDRDNDSDAVTLSINSVSSNQDAPDGTSECPPSNGPDWIIGPPVSSTDPHSAATTVELRAQRCANAGSRVYTISVTCTDGLPENTTALSQTVDMTVTVPHDQGH